MFYSCAESLDRYIFGTLVVRCVFFAGQTWIFPWTWCMINDVCAGGLYGGLYENFKIGRTQNL